jgi:hypothetical protein
MHTVKVDRCPDGRTKSPGTIAEKRRAEPVSLKWVLTWGLVPALAVLVSLIYGAPGAQHVEYTQIVDTHVPYIPAPAH